jgi:hypothetical protein
MDLFIVGLKVTPRILTWVWKVIPNAVAGSVQFVVANAFNFSGLSLAREARS